MNSRRESIRRHLETLSSEEYQLDWEHEPPGGNITADLVTMWFDFFHFGKPGAVSEDLVFHEAELAALTAFHQFFSERKSLLPESHGTVRTWHASPVWREIMEDARKTLELISAEGNAGMTLRREQVRWQLEGLASEEEQLQYERDVPHVDITAELICQWFDDLFHGSEPGEWPYDATFSETELTALVGFHQFYSECKRLLPESQGTVRTWLASPVWREIMEEARKTLEKISKE